MMPTQRKRQFYIMNPYFLTHFNVLFMQIY